MENELKFDKNNYKIRSLEAEGVILRYRAFEGIPYVTNPAAPDMQVLNLFVPEYYYGSDPIGTYTLKTASIFLPNSAGGYMPGPARTPEVKEGAFNTIARALLHGYVVASPGIRGRQMKDKKGNYVGMAPAALVDLKAAVRYLRHNRDVIPGDVEKIVSNGTSAGGALSSLLGATGNHPDYEPYLEKIGAAKERDDIFAASCYCPITNLDHADMAYEWEFGNEIAYRNWRGEGVMSPLQQELSALLKVQFPSYVNSLGLLDEKKQPLELDENGNGTLKEEICRYVCRSAQKEIDWGGDLTGLDWLKVDGSVVTGIDFDGYVEYRTRMKTAPAFDSVFMGTPENELFGTADVMERHFTEFSLAHSQVVGGVNPAVPEAGCAGAGTDPAAPEASGIKAGCGSGLSGIAESNQIRMMNPMPYIADPSADVAPNYRIRHGAVDRDTSLAISALLAAALRGRGTAVDLAYPWGLPHAGDYDLEELFLWIDACAK
ncbi:MAG: alpha/beta hydrolase [Lachnospiraceae bacterium]|nr:alpha/beta hydrolase [Lachnospiraceae bacterium]